jgi:hypothetical protein
VDPVPDPVLLTHVNCQLGNNEVCYVVICFAVQIGFRVFRNVLRV